MAADGVMPGVPADAGELAAHPCGPELVAMDAPGHFLWDNGMYVEVHVHLGLGRWWDASSDAGWERLGPAVRTEYAGRCGGHSFPAPGARLQDLRRRFPGA